MNAYGQFDPIQDFDSLTSSQLPKTCIVSGELVGLFKNGGLGTATTGLAELLSAFGGDVTVIYTGRTDSKTEHWIRKYAEAGIKVELLKSDQKKSLVGPYKQHSWTNAWVLLEQLRNKQFEVIHFNDTLGEGCYCFLAKKYGMAFEKTLLSLAVHSPVEWILESNRKVPDNLWYSMCMGAERISILSTDVLWGPSRYLLDWLKQRGYDLPSQVFRQQYVIPSQQLFEPGRDKIKPRESTEEEIRRRFPSEVVFFGRLEERKGLRLFAETLDKLNGEFHRQDISVTFLGKQGFVEGSGAGQFLQSKADHWAFDWRIEEHMGQQEAISYLRQANCLAVMASPVDNSPCTVYEALHYGIPFVACKSGGIPELISEKFHATHLFDYTVESLAHIISQSISNGVEAPKPAIDRSKNQASWLNFHVNWADYLPHANTMGQPGVWGVYIDNRGADRQLLETVQAVNDARDPSISCIATNARNTTLASGADPNILFIERGGRKGLDECISYFKKNGVTHFCSLSAGVLPKANLFQALSIALESQAEAVVPAIELLSSQKTVLPMAGSSALAFLEHQIDPGVVAVRLDNRIFLDAQANLMVSRPHFGLLDELYSRNARIWPYPAALATTEDFENLKVFADEYSTLQAFSSAPAREIFQILSIARPHYPKISDTLSANPKSILSKLKRYLYSNPKPVRVVFGNRIAKSVARLLYKLSRLP